MKYLTCDPAIMICKSITLPYFDHWAIVNAFTSIPEKMKLQNLQDRCITICTRRGMKQLHTDNHIRTLGKRGICHVRNYMQKNTCTNNCHEDENSITARSYDANSFEINNLNVESYKRSISYELAMDWNGLNAESRNIENVDAFKFRQRNIKPL